LLKYLIMKCCSLWDFLFNIFPPFLSNVWINVNLTIYYNNNLAKIIYIPYNITLDLVHGSTGMYIEDNSSVHYRTTYSSYLKQLIRIWDYNNFSDIISTTTCLFSQEILVLGATSRHMRNHSQIWVEWMN